ncbi:MAG: enoyl-CoA hydratase-related protein, partial [Desulforhabdus sp.]|nr:enoyl-CoA hydratase-related protein [Desulforhabdus sp.]
MDYQEIIFEQRGPIAYLTLNRPDIRNAISSDLIIDEIVDVCTRAQADHALKVLVVSGAGSSFSAGGNIKDMHERKGMFSGNPEQLRDNYRTGIQRIPIAFSQLDIPTIAAVNGPAIGAGCDLACMCDIRIASENARFGETFVSVGLIPGDGGTFFLPRIVGFAKACELTFTSRIIDAREALRIGLVNEVVAPERLLERSRQMAEEIAKQPGKILRMAKRL